VIVRKITLAFHGPYHGGWQATVEADNGIAGQVLPLGKGSLITQATTTVRFTGGANHKVWLDAITTLSQLAGQAVEAIQNDNWAPVSEKAP
jgi:hypothetical protein